MVELDVGFHTQANRCNNTALFDFNAFKKEASQVLCNQVQKKWDQCWESLVGRTRQAKQNESCQERMFLVVVQGEARIAYWDCPGVLRTKFLR